MKQLVEGDSDTICAPITPPGIGGVSVIRLSGEKSIECIRTLNPKLKELRSHHVYYGFIQDRNNEKIDEVLISYFEPTRSYTGEHVIEISSHGSPYIVERILNELVSLGSRLARPGEFSYRAFLNGRVDLVQAESVLSLIHSKSKSAADLAIRNLKGGLSEEIKSIEDELTWCMAQIEANIDFSSEGIDVLPRREVESRLHSAQEVIKKLLDSFSYGQACDEGLNVIIIGEPNVGKSTLFNLLAQEDRAIVTEVPGTTRDLIETKISYKGVLFNLFDTAGLRTDTTDKIELIGIQKTRKKITHSEFVILVIDATRESFSSEEIKLISNLNTKKSIIIFNKSDALGANTKSFNKEQFILDKIGQEFFDQFLLKISAQKVEERTKVLDKIHSFVAKMGRDHAGLAIFNSRQYECLSLSRNLISEALELIRDGLGEEIVSIPLKTALIEVQKMHGTYYDDQILDRVFKEFCIGK